MRVLILIAIICCFHSCALTGMLKKVKPVCITWQKAIEEVLPDKYFTKQDNQIRVSGNFVNPALSVCVYKCSGDLYVILEEDWNTSLNDPVNPVRYFDNIYVLDNGKVTHASFPQGHNHKVVDSGDEIKILLDYIYKTEFSVQLSYKEGELKTLKQKGSFKN